MADQTLDDAPVWSDLATFDGGAWRGSVDLVLAGFPCQPASVAGRRRGAADGRWLWPHVWRIFKECGARCLVFENVGGIRSKNLLGQILVDMARGGLTAEWTSLAAGEVGASHRRTRLFLVAYSERPERWSEARRLDSRGSSTHEGSNTLGEATSGTRECRKPLAYSRLGGDHPHQHGGVEREGGQGATGACASGYEMANTDEQRRQLQWGLFAPGPADPRWADIIATAPYLEPAICGVAYGLADRIHRLRAAGNGVVPLQAAAAITHLFHRILND